MTEIENEGNKLNKEVNKTSKKILKLFKHKEIIIVCAIILLSTIIGIMVCKARRNSKLKLNDKEE